MSSLKK